MNDFATTPPAKPQGRGRLWTARILVAAMLLALGLWAAEQGVLAYEFKKLVPTGGFGLATDLASLSAEELDRRLTDMKATGATWVRFDLSWDAVQHQSSSSYNWSAYDSLAKATAAHGFKVLMIIDFVPSWAAAPGCNSPQLCRPSDPAAYARFAGEAAGHFRPYGVRDWEIWNEPNISFRFAPSADPTLYAQMLKLSYRAIKRADPLAMVVTGGTSPSATDGSNYSPLDFLKALYADGAKGSFDALAAHPYTAPISPSQAHSTDAWGQLALIHDTMAAHGDGNKRIWATEFGAATNGPNSASNRVTEDFQARIATEGLTLFRRQPWAGPMFWYDYIDAGTTADTTEHFYGLLRADGSHKPAYDAFVKAVAASR